MTRQYLFAGAISGFLAVGFSAFGAHALKGILTGHMLDIYHTAAEYQMYHSLILVFTAILILLKPDSRVLHWGARFFISGVFSNPEMSLKVGIATYASARRS